MRPWASTRHVAGWPPHRSRVCQFDRTLIEASSLSRWRNTQVQYLVPSMDRSRRKHSSSFVTFHRSSKFASWKSRAEDHTGIGIYASWPNWGMGTRANYNEDLFEMTLDRGSITERTWLTYLLYLPSLKPRYPDRLPFPPSSCITFLT